MNIYLYIINFVRKNLYEESISLDNYAGNVLEIMRILATILQEIPRKGFMISGKKNKLTNNLILNIEFIYNSKKVIINKSGNNYRLFYKGQVISFTNKTKYVLKNKWDKLNAKSLSYFEA